MSKTRLVWWERQTADNPDTHVSDILTEKGVQKFVSPQTCRRRQRQGIWLVCCLSRKMKDWRAFQFLDLPVKERYGRGRRTSQRLEARHFLCCGGAGRGPLTSRQPPWCPWLRRHAGFSRNVTDPVILKEATVCAVNVECAPRAPVVWRPRSPASFSAQPPPGRREAGEAAEEGVH